MVRTTRHALLQRMRQVDLFERGLCNQIGDGRDEEGDNWQMKSQKKMPKKGLLRKK